MDKKKSLELIEVYPEFFQDIHPQEPFALFGFECGEGWFNLLKECLEEIKEICQKKKISPKVAQIKEKFGTLRFYVNFYECCLKEPISKAEEASKVTCELCGDPASLKDHCGWYSVKCDKCWQKHCERFDENIK
jgi:hypothetical protein